MLTPLLKPQVTFTLQTPMVSIPFAMVLLNLDRDEVRHLVEDGSLEVAWDIARPQTKAREIRILHLSLLAFIERRKNPLPDMPAIMDAMFPKNYSPSLQTIAGKFGCSPELIRQHTKLGTLKLLPGDKPRRGPRGSPRILRPSLMEFLEKRRII